MVFAKNTFYQKIQLVWQLFRLLKVFFKFWPLKTNLKAYIAEVQTLKDSSHQNGKETYAQTKAVSSIYLKVQLVSSLLAIQLVRHAYLASPSTAQLTSLQRLLHYDFTLFLNCPPSLNYLLAGCCLEELYFLYLMYGLQNRNDLLQRSLKWLWWPVLLADEVLFSCGLKSGRFFIQKSIKVKGRWWWHFREGVQTKRRTEKEVVRRYTWYWILVARYMMLFAGK